MICIDSDCLIDFLKGHDGAMGILEQYKGNLMTTEINMFEVFLGLYLRGHAALAGEDLAFSFFQTLEVLKLDGWGIMAAKLVASLRDQGKMIEQNDCFIASIMLAHGCQKIITRNADHFSRIEGIEALSY